MGKMRSRAAILPYPGDPFLFRHWLTFFDTIWGSEVDQLYVYMNSTVELPVVEYVQSLCDAREKITLFVTPTQIEHGECINRMLEFVTEENVMLIEDDGFIIKPGMVDHCFSLLESGDFDIVGSKRGSCSTEISDAAKAKFNLDYSGLGDVGCNFWPNFFFCSRQLLESTDRNFGARAWNRGETIESLGCVVEVPVVAGDTFVNTSLQLRNMVPERRICYVPQYHAHPNDMIHAERGTHIFDGKAPWVHIGSLSSGIGGILKDDQNRPLARRTIDPPAGDTRLGAQPQTDMEKKEWERRVQMWLTFWTEAFCDTSTDVIHEFRALYGDACNRIVNDYNLDAEAIKTRIRTYKKRLGI